MKKVLFVVDERKLGGVSILLEGILNNLDRDNLDVSVLVLHNSGDRLENLNKDIKVIYGTKAFDVIDIDFKTLVKEKKYLKAFKKMYISILMKTGLIKYYILKERKKLNINVDTEIAFKAGFCSLFVAYGDSKRKLNWVHEDYKTYNKTKKYEKLFKKAFRAFDRHIIVSDDARKSFNEIYAMEDKSYTIENYIDIKDILNKACEKTEGVVLDKRIDNSKINFVTLGRFSKEKGFDRLIDAINLLKNIVDISSLNLYIIGYGNEKDELIKKIKDYNLEDTIFVLDSKVEFNSNPYPFMKQCDVYVLSSYTESFGMVRIEALTLGLPVITTDVANSHSMINSSLGLIVDNNTEGLVQGMEYILKNKEMVDTLKANVKDYSYDKRNEKILAKIKELLEV